MVDQFQELYESELAERRQAIRYGTSPAKQIVKNTLMNTYLASGFPLIRKSCFRTSAGVR